MSLARPRSITFLSRFAGPAEHDPGRRVASMPKQRCHDLSRVGGLDGPSSGRGAGAVKYLQHYGTWWPLPGTGQLAIRGWRQCGRRLGRCGPDRGRMPLERLLHHAHVRQWVVGGRRERFDLIHRYPRMRSLTLALSLAWARLLAGQDLSNDSTLYLLIDTARVKWDRPGQVCGSGRVGLSYAYVFSEPTVHTELMCLSRRTLKSSRRYDRLPCRFYFSEETRRMEKLERFRIDNCVGSVRLTAAGIRLLSQQKTTPTEHRYRLFGEEHHYHMVRTTPQFVDMLGGTIERRR